MTEFWSLAIYIVPLVVITALYGLRQRRTHARHRQVLEDTLSSGMTEPASLHPLIDESKCLGCGACVTACPETSHHDVLGLIDGKAVLIGWTATAAHSHNGYLDNALTMGIPGLALIVAIFVVAPLRPDLQDRNRLSADPRRVAPSRRADRQVVRGGRGTRCRPRRGLAG